MDHGYSARGPPSGIPKPLLAAVRRPFDGPWPTPRVAPGAPRPGVLRPSPTRDETAMTAWSGRAMARWSEWPKGTRLRPRCRRATAHDSQEVVGGEGFEPPTSSV